MRDASLVTKLNLSLLAFFLVLGVATSAILVYGSKRAQDGASTRSREALEDLGSLALSAVVGGTAEQGGILFSNAETTGSRAAIYLETVGVRGSSTPAPDVRWTLYPSNGIRYVDDPHRVSDVMLLDGVDPADPAVQDEVAYLAPLDDLFPALMAGLSPANAAFDPAAISFIGVHGSGRYYPARGVYREVPPGMTLSKAAPQFEAVGPEADPDRRTIWSEPYEDNAGQGLVVTAETPVYEGDTFRGVLQVDLLIQNLMDQIDTIKPTPGSFAFYVAADGDLMKGAAYDRVTQAAAADPDFSAILDAMGSADQIDGVEVRKVRFDDAEYFVAFASMPSLGGSFAVASPVSEITASAEAITAGIEGESNRTLQIMLGAMGSLFVVGLAGASYLNRRVLLRPISELVSGARAIGGGALDTAIPVRAHDELGTLAEAFNQMTTNLNETEGRYKRIFDSSADGLIISRLDGVVVDANAAACEMHGYSHEEFIAIAAPAHIHPRYQQQRDAWVEAMRQGLPSSLRAVAIRRDGSTFDVDVRTVPLQYRGELHLLSVLRDVSVEVRAEQVLEVRVEERTRDLQLLLEVSQNVASVLEVRDLAGRVLDRLGSVFAHDGAGMLVIEADEVRVLQTRDAQGLGDPELVDSRFRLPLVGPAGEAITTRRTVVVADVLADPELAAQQAGVPGRAAAGRSWLAAPLIVQDRVLGVLTIWSAEPDMYGPDDAELATAVANQAAIALENARLFAEASTVAALEERQRLARELHDSVSQALYGIALGAQTARQLVESDPARAVDPIEYVASLAEAGLAEMRALIFELRPESLASEGIVSALEKQVAATRARYGVAVVADLPEEPDVPLRVKEALYRIAQEAMHNTIKHARASRIDIRLAASAERTQLEIGDDGSGFVADGDFPGHLGLRSMRERADAVGGTLTIVSAPGTGTTVRADVPRQPVS